MSAHHAKHAITCPAYGNGELVRCTCGAPGSAKAKERSLAMTPAETVAEINKLSAPTANRNAMVASTNARIAAGVAAPPINVLGVAFSPPDNDDDEIDLGEIDVDRFDDSEWREHRSAERELRRIGDEVGRLLQRTVDVTRRGRGPDATLTIAQRCAACRTDIEDKVSGEGDTLALVAAVGVKARVSYARHKCAPVEQSLHSFTWDELRELEQSLEAESLRIAQRVVDIQRLAKERR